MTEPGRRLNNTSSRPLGDKVVLDFLRGLHVRGLLARAGSAIPVALGITDTVETESEVGKEYQMGIGSWARRTVWTGLDRARGRPIQRHVDDIAAAFSDPDAVPEHQAGLLNKLMNHACSTTSHYRPFAGARTLADFPVLQKREIRENYDGFVSSVYDRDSLVPVTTSGSYGTPFTFLLTRDKHARRKAEVIYFSGWCDYTLGDRYAYVTCRVGGKSRWDLLLQNEVSMNPMVLDAAWLEESRQIVLSSTIEVLIGYPSAIGALAAHCRSRGDDRESFPSVRSVLTIAEPLRPAVRDVISDVFGCPVSSRYSTQESGVLAQECECGNYHLNVASYVFEILAPRSTAPVTAGELGRIVVTDLYSHAMPLVRYDTGDLAIRGDNCPCGRQGPLLTSLHGRVVEEVTGTRGQRISPFAVNNAMRDIDGVVQFQFVQTHRQRYELRLCVCPSFQSEREIRRRLISILGDAADLRVRRVSQILPLPSGKRPYIVNEWAGVRGD